MAKSNKLEPSAGAAKPRVKQTNKTKVAASKSSKAVNQNMSKAEQLLALLHRPGGATIEQMVDATGWQAHSIRGFMSGSLKKKHGVVVTSQKRDGIRIYRAEAEGAQG